MHHLLSDLQGIGIGTGLVLVGVWKILEHFNIFKRDKTTASDMMAEIQFKDNHIGRLEGELGKAKDANARLAAERSLESVMESLTQNSTLQGKILDRLVHHNGSFVHMEQALGHIEESLKLIVGYIIGQAHSVPPEE